MNQAEVYGTAAAQGDVIQCSSDWQPSSELSLSDTGRASGPAMSDMLTAGSGTEATLPSTAVCSIHTYFFQ